MRQKQHHNKTKRNHLVPINTYLVILLLFSHTLNSKTHVRIYATHTHARAISSPYVFFRSLAVSLISYGHGFVCIIHNRHLSFPIVHLQFRIFHIDFLFCCILKFQRVVFLLLFTQIIYLFKLISVFSPLQDENAKNADVN